MPVDSGRYSNCERDWRHVVINGSGWADPDCVDSQIFDDSGTHVERPVLAEPGSTKPGADCALTPRSPSSAVAPRRTS